MKKEVNLLRVVLSVILVIAIGIGAVFCLGSNKANYDEITEIQIRPINPMMSLDQKEYRLCFENGEWNVYYTDGYFAEEAQKFVADEAFVNEIINILEKNQVHKWNPNSLKYRINKKMVEIAMDRGSLMFYIGYANGDETEVDASLIDGAPEVFNEVMDIFISLIGETETE